MKCGNKLPALYVHLHLHSAFGACGAACVRAVLLWCGGGGEGEKNGMAGKLTAILFACCCCCHQQQKKKKKEKQKKEKRRFFFACLWLVLLLLLFHHHDKSTEEMSLLFPLFHNLNATATALI